MAKLNRKYIGSTLDSFLKEEGIFNEVTKAAKKKAAKLKKKMATWPAPKKCPRCGSHRVEQRSLARWECKGCDKRWSVRKKYVDL